MAMMPPGLSMSGGLQGPPQGPQGPPMPLMPPGMMPGAPPPGMGPQGLAPIPGVDDYMQLGMSALDQLTNKQPNGEVAVEQVKKALYMCQQLISAVIPTITRFDSKTAKDLHVIGRQIADAQINLVREADVGPPPEMLLGGIQGTGLPGGPTGY